MTRYEKRKICDVCVDGIRGGGGKEEGRKWGGQEKERKERREEKEIGTTFSKYKLGYLNLKDTSYYQVLPRWPKISMNNRSQD